MRWLLTLALAALAVYPAAAAEPNAAEKLYRDMEQKVRAAKTLRVRFDLTITDSNDKEGKVKGALTLGEGDKYRAEGDGKMFGEAVRFVEVSDGARVKTTEGLGAPKDDKEEKSAKGVGAYLRAALPREGFFLSTLDMDRRDDRPPGGLILADFELGDKEWVGKHNAQIVRYAITEKGTPYLSMKMWLDVDTHLPVRLVVTGGTSDWKKIVETYDEFVLDPAVEAKAFEAPK